MGGRNGRSGVVSPYNSQNSYRVTECFFRSWMLLYFPYPEGLVWEPWSHGTLIPTATRSDSADSLDSVPLSRCHLPAFCVLRRCLLRACLGPCLSVRQSASSSIGAIRFHPFSPTPENGEPRCSYKRLRTLLLRRRLDSCAAASTSISSRP